MAAPRIRPVTALTAGDLARLRAMPPHPVHTIAMRNLDRNSGSRIAQLFDPVTDAYLDGYLIFHASPLEPRVAHLDYLYVASPARGYGSRLVRGFEAHVGAERPLPCAPLTISVMATMAARGFYEARGYHQDHWHALRMLKILPPRIG